MHRRLVKDLDSMQWTGKMLTAKILQASLWMCLSLLMSTAFCPCRYPYALVWLAHQGVRSSPARRSLRGLVGQRHPTAASEPLTSASRSHLRDHSRISLLITSSSATTHIDVLHHPTAQRPLLLVSLPRRVFREDAQESSSSWLIS